MNLILLPPCNHSNVFDPYHGKKVLKADEFRAAMGIDWMPIGGGDHGKAKVGTVDQAIPPAYTEFIGAYLLDAVAAAAAQRGAGRGGRGKLHLDRS